jgi:hypothetical protein
MEESGNTEEKVRLEPQTLDLIQNNFTGPHSTWDSTRSFLTDAVESMAEETMKKVPHGGILRSMVRELNTIDGIEYELPQLEVEPRWGNNNFSSPRGFEVQEKKLGYVQETMKKSGMTKQDAMRTCIFMFLDSLLDRRGVKVEPREKEEELEIRTSMVKARLEDPRSRFIETINRAFCERRKVTEKAIKRNPGRFLTFCGIYQRQFEDTNEYKWVRTNGGGKALRKIEELIEKAREKEKMMEEAELEWSDG